MDYSQFLVLLPAILAILVPPITEIIKKILIPFVGKIPKPMIPIIAAIIGAVGEVLVTGNLVPILGAAVGAGGTGVRDVIHNARITGG